METFTDVANLVRSVGYSDVSNQHAILDNQSYLAIGSDSIINRVHYIRFRAAANRSYSVVYRGSATVGPWLKLSDIERLFGRR
jgi:hypothetical protein